MTVPVTVFHLPNGQRTEETTELDDSLQSQYTLMTDHGMRFTAERLSTGQISLCVEHPELGDFDCAVVPDGPKVQDAMERMLRRLTAEDVVAWLGDSA